MAVLNLADVQPRYLWLDPGSGKQGSRVRSTRARSAIVVVGGTADTRVWALDAWAGRIGTTGIVTAFCDMVEKWNPIVAAYEDMAQQSLLADPINEEADRRNIIVPLSPVTVTTRVDKLWRIRTILQPLIASGRLMIDASLVSLVNEITNFPVSTVRDLVDALAGACSLVPPPAAKQASNDEVNELAAYLRASGASPAHIEAAVAEARGESNDQTIPKWVRDLRQIGYGIKVRS